ncbi:peroxisomal bifunctional enzyme [Ambystoma mexicanum]|uniref:peroxisomal bifunctional enzyme n=1 Tax=Ambystoma mexicanum TaxID=8296 RepID=UPI0037E762C2
MSALKRMLGPVAVITISNPPVNALSPAVQESLLKVLKEINLDPTVKAIVLGGENGKFSAGADIRTFQTREVRSAASLEDVNSALEKSTKPIVAAIEGVALGGGLELALGCHYRLAHVKAQVALPEVLLGLLPGAGGTQRLPRLIGIPAALEIITTGQYVSAPAALKLGLLDSVVEDNVVQAAVDLAHNVIGQPLEPRRLCMRPLPCPPNVEKLFDEAKVKLKKQFRGAKSHQVCVDAVRAAVELPFAEGILKERELFLTLFSSDQAKARQYAFFAERSVARWTAPSGANWKSASPRPIRTAAVIGLGTMGRGIAVSLARAGIQVIALEQDKKQLEMGSKAVMSIMERETQKKQQLGHALNAPHFGFVKFTLDFNELGNADLVIEAVYENMALKKEIFQRLSKMCKPETFLCTNTSGLNIDEIASVTDRPHLVIGTHFFSPANIMRLLEVVRGYHSSPTTISTVMNLSKVLGKIAVVVGNCPLFVGNRLMGPYVEQAVFLLEDGYTPNEVDQVLEEFGFAMGPFRMSDLAGLDVGWRSRMERGLTGPKLSPGVPACQREGKRYSPLPDILCEKGRLGQKTGQGWYQYERAGGRTAVADPWLQSFLEDYRKAHKIRQNVVRHDEILEWCLYPLINEGFKVLEDGIASGPEDIDVIYTHGYGWPKHMGGPMFYASMVGLPRVLTTLETYYESNRDVPSLKPSALLKKLVTQGSPPLKEWRSQLGHHQSSKL